MKPAKTTPIRPTTLRRATQLGLLGALALPLCARFALSQGYSTGDEAEVSAPQGDPEALSRGLESVQRGDFGRAFPELMRASQRGERIASYLCGLLLRRGLGVRADAKAARQAFEEAARGPQLFAMASTEFADCLIQGFGGPKDTKRGLEILEKAASAGHASAMFKLGLAHMTGQGTERDPARAYAWFTVAADHKHEYALNNLVAIGSRLSEEQLARGKKLSREIHDLPKYRGGQIQFQMNFDRAIDEAFHAALASLDKGESKSAIRQLAMLARGNHGPAKLELGRMHAEGRGVAKNAVEAAKLYASGLGQCRGAALNALATCFAKGLGVKQDAEAALALRKAAAWRNDADAQNRYGLAFIQGKGVERSPIQAYVWWKLASGGGHKHAKKNLALLLEQDLPEKRLDEAKKAHKQAQNRIVRNIVPGWPRVELGTPAIFGMELEVAKKRSAYASGDEEVARTDEKKRRPYLADSAEDSSEERGSEEDRAKDERADDERSKDGGSLETYRSRDGRMTVQKPRGWTVEEGDIFGGGTYGVTVDNADETAGLMFMVAPGGAQRFRNSKHCSEVILGALGQTLKKLRVLETFSSPDGSKTGVEAQFEIEGVVTRGFFQFTIEGKDARMMGIGAKKEIFGDMRPTLQRIAQSLRYPVKGSGFGAGF